MGYEKYYMVSDNGMVKSLPRLCNTHHSLKMVRKEKFLKVYEHPSGYNVVTLIVEKNRKLCAVHRLVGMAFIPNPGNKPQINHIDCNRRNNHVSNLEWCTNGENQRHAVANGLHRSLMGDEHSNSKTNSTDVIKIRELHRLGDMTNREIGAKFGLTKGHIKQIVSRITWKHI